MSGRGSRWWWIALPVAALALIAALALSGAVSTAPPEGPPAKLTPPKRVLLTEKAKSALRGELQRAAAQSGNRSAQEMTIRIRNISCGSLAVGSGVALSRHLIATNAHVVSHALWLELNTWDGRDVRVDIDGAESRKINDLALVYVKQKLPRSAVIGSPAERGDKVSVVGYPGAGPLKISRGEVVRRVDGQSLGGVAVQSPVMVLSADVQHGSSGGPVLDESGELVGIIYAGKFTSSSESAVSKRAYAIPVRTLTGLLRSDAPFDPIRPC